MSIARQAAHDRLPQKLLLLYSNHRPEDAAYLTELADLERTNRNFQMLATMTEVNRSTQTWLGLAGRIDGELIRRVGRGHPTPVFYVTGSPSMVSSMRKLLNEADVDDEDIRGEEFFGY
jgi:ferredoxin-NADP reductase